MLTRDWEKNSTEDSEVSCARLDDLKKLYQGQDVNIEAILEEDCVRTFRRGVDEERYRRMEFSNRFFRGEIIETKSPG